MLSTKADLLYLLYSTNPGVLSSASDKEKLFAQKLNNNSNLEDSSIFLPAFSSVNDLNWHDFSLTQKMVKKVIMSLGLSKAFDPDRISVVILKNCEHKLSYILAELFNLCLKESFFPDCWKVSIVVPIFKNFGERSTTTTLLVFSL